MTLREQLYRAGTYLRHLFTSWNTGGEGIHSPYLFYLVRMLIYDQNRYYCWDDIEQQRRRLLRSRETIRVVDYGTGGRTVEGEPEATERRLCDIAATSLEQARVGQVLFRLVCYLGHVQQRPLRIVELGTSLGITTAYLAAADSRNSVVTYEGSEALLEQAREVWRRLKIDNIRTVPGNIDETLLRTPARDNIIGAGDEAPIDIAYLDANHTYEATMRYYTHLAQRAQAHSIYIVDDIHHSEQMARAWREIGQREEVSTTMDFYHFGLVFFDPHYLKRHYKLRM
jgi:predicted O-methyltransferase YrrM